MGPKVYLANSLNHLRVQIAIALTPRQDWVMLA